MPPQKPSDFLCADVVCDKIIGQFTSPYEALNAALAFGRDNFENDDVWLGYLQDYFPEERHDVEDASGVKLTHKKTFVHYAKDFLKKTRDILATHVDYENYHHTNYLISIFSSKSAHFNDPTWLRLALNANNTNFDIKLKAFAHTNFYFASAALSHSLFLKLHDAATTEHRDYNQVHLERDSNQTLLENACKNKDKKTLKFLLESFDPQDRLNLFKRRVKDSYNIKFIVQPFLWMVLKNTPDSGITIFDSLDNHHVQEIVTSLDSERNNILCYVRDELVLQTILPFFTPADIASTLRSWEFRQNIGDNTSYLTLLLRECPQNERLNIITNHLGFLFDDSLHQGWSDTLLQCLPKDDRIKAYNYFKNNYLQSVFLPRTIWNDGGQEEKTYNPYSEANLNSFLTALTLIPAEDLVQGLLNLNVQPDKSQRHTYDGSTILQKLLTVGQFQEKVLSKLTQDQFHLLMLEVHHNHASPKHIEQTSSQAIKGHLGIKAHHKKIIVGLATIGLIAASIGTFGLAGILTILPALAISLTAAGATFGVAASGLALHSLFKNNKKPPINDEEIAPAPMIV